MTIGGYEYRFQWLFVMESDFGNEILFWWLLSSYVLKEGVFEVLCIWMSFMVFIFRCSAYIQCL